MKDIDLTGFHEIKYPPFSVNSMYEVAIIRDKNNNIIDAKMQCTERYRNWKKNFPMSTLPSFYEMWVKQGIRLNQPMKLSVAFIAPYYKKGNKTLIYDTDNLVKYFQDRLFHPIFTLRDEETKEIRKRFFNTLGRYGANDTLIEHVDARKIANCENKEDARIFFKLENIKEQ